MQSKKEAPVKRAAPSSGKTGYGNNLADVGRRHEYSFMAK